MSLAVRYLAHLHQASERLIHYPVCRSSSKLVLKATIKSHIYTYVYVFNNVSCVKLLKQIGWQLSKY